LPVFNPVSLKSLNRPVSEKPDPVIPLLLAHAWAALSSMSQVPIYNSYPAAAPVIFLDFDGYTVSGTGWNYDGPIYCGGSGLDSTQITEVFNRVLKITVHLRSMSQQISTKYLSAPVNHEREWLLL
jgi:hypothetical protein